MRCYGSINLNYCKSKYLGLHVFITAVLKKVENISSVQRCNFFTLKLLFGVMFFYYPGLIFLFGKFRGSNGTIFIKIAYKLYFFI
jgi:hypothetical protein